jgi:hypothetical protein
LFIPVNTPQCPPTAFPSLTSRHHAALSLLLDANPRPPSDLIERWAQYLKLDNELVESWINLASTLPSTTNGTFRDGRQCSFSAVKIEPKLSPVPSTQAPQIPVASRTYVAPGEPQLRCRLSTPPNSPSSVPSQTSPFDSPQSMDMPPPEPYSPTSIPLAHPRPSRYITLDDTGLERASSPRSTCFAGHASPSAPTSPLPVHSSTPSYQNQANFSRKFEKSPPVVPSQAASNRHCASVTQQVYPPSIPPNRMPLGALSQGIRHHPYAKNSKPSSGPVLPQLPRIRTTDVRLPRLTHISSPSPRVLRNDALILQHPLLLPLTDHSSSGVCSQIKSEEGWNSSSIGGVARSDPLPVKMEPSD